MDKIKINMPNTNDTSSVWTPLSDEDMSILQHVLKSVRGSYPAEPYRQADFAED